MAMLNKQIPKKENPILKRMINSVFLMKINQKMKPKIIKPT
jgi:hypothetical protein